MRLLAINETQAVGGSQLTTWTLIQGGAYGGACLGGGWGAWQGYHWLRPHFPLPLALGGSSGLAYLGWIVGGIVGASLVEIFLFSLEKTG